ncbi:hypothetical protein A1O3_09956 [Capronia epimyces CBS 606.96]|uniref:UDP-N-acetylglucosamine transferase subunit ALG14 n=1 Tax=Capronia epimyces CBS 606.96 TaxID=1182542 RepID=W9XB54_9EURO|nr:uncharacterized protein A1O3_09956 [Capronia epimyces CBS 606.96]EXJ77727.1 hypothetical protein A1O3_09956 [Capronia epimyces CBS 606.96]
MLDIGLSLSSTRQLMLIVSATTFLLLTVAFFRLISVLSREPPSPRPRRSALDPTHVLIVLGSGGHTAEMLNILSQTPHLQLDFTYRTYVVSSGDDFSALKAHDFEKSLLSNLETSGISIPEGTGTNYDVVTVYRARKVHQSLLTAQISSLRCLWDCFAVLRGTHRDIGPQRRTRATRLYPDLILTNGPGTGVIVILASIILRFFGSNSRANSWWQSTKQTVHSAGSRERQNVSYTQAGQMRSIFIESWARVKSLSLSGRLLKPFVDRFVVQWPQLVEEGESRVEYIGPLIT